MHGDEQLARIKLSDGKVLLISNFSFIQRFLHADFICNPGPGVVADSGRLMIFELYQKDEGSPSFTARWDGNRADRQPLDLELDISSVPVSVIRKFRNNRDGYNGYHVEKSPDSNRRLYEVRIETPSGLLLDADISFFSTYELAPHILHVDTAMEVEAQGANGLTRESEKKPGTTSIVGWLKSKLRRYYRP